MTFSLDRLAKKVGHELKQRGLKLATAESCTGGGVSYWITRIPGSSDWFECGFVTYSNAAKVEMLGVDPLTIKTAGSVSEHTVHEMAEGALKKSHADIAIAITGIAGPAGGSAEKPIGTVWIAWAGRNSPTETQIDVFPGGRQAIRMRAIKAAFEGLLARLK